MNDISRPKSIGISFIDACYDLLDKYKVMDEQAIGERIVLPDGNFYLELRADNLILCDSRITSKQIKSSTYQYADKPTGIAVMLSRYLDLLNNEGYFNKDQKRSNS